MPDSGSTGAAERVARALYEYDRDVRAKRRSWEGFRAHYERMARAALAALQQEPRRTSWCPHHGSECPNLAAFTPGNPGPLTPDELDAVVEALGEWEGEGFTVDIPGCRNERLDLTRSALANLRALASTEGDG